MWFCDLKPVTNLSRSVGKAGSIQVFDWFEQIFLEQIRALYIISARPLDIFPPCQPPELYRLAFKDTSPLHRAIWFNCTDHTYIISNQISCVITQRSNTAVATYDTLYVPGASDIRSHTSVVLPMLLLSKRCHGSYNSPLLTLSS